MTALRFIFASLLVWVAMPSLAQMTGASFSGASYVLVDPTPPPDGAPYDITDWSAEIAESLGTHTWPTEPTLSGDTTTISTNNCSALNTSVSTQGMHTIVETGLTFSGCGTIVVAPDTWTEFQGTATVNGVFHGGTSDRIKITGGTFNPGNQVNFNGDDVLVQNGVWTRTPGNSGCGESCTLWSGANVHRQAYVNNTIQSGDYALIYNPWNTVNSDLTFVGNDIICSLALTVDEACIRIQGTSRPLVGGNRFEKDGGKESVRFYAAASDGLVIENVVHNTSSGIQGTHSGASSNDTQAGDINNMHFLNNLFFQDGAGGKSAVNLQENNPGSPYNCTANHVEGNTKISNTPVEFTIGGSGCTGTTSSGNTTNDLVADWSSTIPTCATLTPAQPAYGCGADH